MKVLNLYAGIGGNRQLWEDVEVTAVEHDYKIAAIYKDFYPNDEIIIGDAHNYLLKIIINMILFGVRHHAKPIAVSGKIFVLDFVEQNPNIPI